MSEGSRAAQHAQAFALLRQFARPGAAAATERCDLCGTPLPANHQHLAQPAARRLMCACEACAVVLADGANTGYRRVPARVRLLSAFQLTDQQWDALLLPIELAFFFHDSRTSRVVAIYPSPAGPTESLLNLEAWDAIVLSNPVLAEMQSDVEALLVNRSGRRPDHAMARYWIVPIDECYRLVGIMRDRWRGFSGGADVWREIDRFFAKLDARAAAGGGAADAASTVEAPHA
jgi:hypothetical protein